MFNFFGGLALIGFGVVLMGGVGVFMSPTSKLKYRWYAVSGFGMVLIIASIIGALVIGGIRLIIGA